MYYSTHSTLLFNVYYNIILASTSRSWRGLLSPHGSLSGNLITKLAKLTLLTDITGVSFKKKADARNRRISVLRLFTVNVCCGVLHRVAAPTCRSNVLIQF